MRLLRGGFVLSGAYGTSCLDPISMIEEKLTLMGVLPEGPVAAPALIDLLTHAIGQLAVSSLVRRHDQLLILDIRQALVMPFFICQYEPLRILFDMWLVQDAAHCVLLDPL